MSDLEPSVSYKPNDKSSDTALKENTNDNCIILNVDSIQKNLEELEKHDHVQPIKSSKLSIMVIFIFSFNKIYPIYFQDYDNKAFELEDVDINAKNESASNFNRTDRPGSMMSIRSTTSRSSRTSVNCTTGRVRCPNLRMKKFYSYKEGAGFQKGFASGKSSCSFRYLI